MTRLSTIFRPVPRTGVIYVMAEAAERGFHYGHPDWVNLGQGAPETGPLPGSLPRVESIELSGPTHEYAPVAGLPELREAVAALYNARYRRGLGSQYTAENVAICAGGRLALTRVATALGSVHLGHALPDYTAYEELLEVFKAFVPIPLVLRPEEGFRLSTERFREAAVGMGLGAFLLSNPCNPTGRTLTGDALRTLVEIGRNLGCALILDEFYSHYHYNGTVGGAVSAARFVEDVDRDPVLLIDGLTKNWRYPGWRLSWTVGPKRIIERVASAGSFLDGGASHPLQQAALPLLTPEAADQEAAAIQRAFGAKREEMLSRLAALGIRPFGVPEGAFYVFAALDGLPPALRDGMAFFEALLEERVICVPGEFFDVNPGKRRSHLPSRLKNFVRLSYGPSMESVRRGLDRIEALVAAHR